MLNTIAIVEAHLDTQRMGRKLAGHSLLERVVRRVTDCERLDRVVVVAGAGVDTNLIEELIPADVAVFASGEPDPLGRFVAVAEAWGASAVVRVSPENPFIEPVFIDRLIKAATEYPGCDYVGYRSRSGQPAMSSCLACSLTGARRPRCDVPIARLARLRTAAR